MNYYSATKLSYLEWQDQTRKLCSKTGKKCLRDNILIRFNSWASIGGRNIKEVHKHMRIRIHLYTDNLGPGGHKNHKETSIGTKIIKKLERIEDSPKVVIKLWQQISLWILPGNPDADPIMVVEELFRSHLTWIALKEFDKIQHDDAAQTLFDEYIEVKFNSCMCKYYQKDLKRSRLDEAGIEALSLSLVTRATEVKTWMATNKKRKQVRVNQTGMIEYKYTFPLTKLPLPPAKPKQGTFIHRSSNGIITISPSA